MIRINLLPDEYRKTERTSPKLFGTVLAAVVCVCCTVGWFGFVYFGQLGQLEIEHGRVTEVLASKQESVKYFEALSKEKKDFEEREQTIAEISRSRVVWSRLLDELIDVVDNQGNTERHFAWFKQLSIKGGDEKKKGATLTMPGWLAGDELRSLADFHEDIEHAPFFKNVKQKSMPTAKTSTDKDRTPAESLSFSLGMEFQPARKWKSEDDIGPKSGAGAKQK